MTESGTAPRGADRAATRAFFGPRAAGWEERFPADEPSYERAVAELGAPRGGVALDAGCGSGRALRYLRAAVGPNGRVLGVDVTPEMLATAVRRGRGRAAAAGAGGPVADLVWADLVLADVRRLPLPVASVDAVFAAGLLPHLADPVAGLQELARVCRPGGRLALFHPIGRAALAHRHGHDPAEDDVRAPAVITAVLTASGWRPLTIDDGEDRYLVTARRSGDAEA